MDDRLPLEALGLKAPSILLPSEDAMQVWGVVACDQYTSEPDYWQRVEALVGGRPSTLRLILPEIYLDGEDEAERIAAIHKAMGRYLVEGVLRDIGEGFVLVKRTVGGRARTGLMAALDLERYDFFKDSASLIRATEGTIAQRIPARLRVRKGAPLELPHVLVLLDDPGKTLIEPLSGVCEKKLYDVELMEGGGRLEGWFIPIERCKGFADALNALYQKKLAENPNAPLLFAVGDGNHSLATAKTAWEAMKGDASPEHPARFALVELENVHDGGIEFEAIHRVVFGVKPDGFLDALCEEMGALRMDYDSWDSLNMALENQYAGQRIPFVHEGGCGLIEIERPGHTLACGSLQIALDELLSKDECASIDYVHGEDVVKSLGTKPSSIGFLLPAFGKGELFSAVSKDGPLPRKAFSMGSAHEKRFYFEARRITD